MFTSHEGSCSELTRNQEKEFDEWAAQNKRDINFGTVTPEIHRLLRDRVSMSQDCEDFEIRIGFLHDTYSMFIDT